MCAVAGCFNSEKVLRLSNFEDRGFPKYGTHLGFPFPTSFLELATRWNWCCQYMFQFSLIFEAVTTNFQKRLVVDLGLQIAHKLEADTPKYLTYPNPIFYPIIFPHFPWFNHHFPEWNPFFCWSMRQITEKSARFAVQAVLVGPVSKRNESVAPRDTVFSLTRRGPSGRGARAARGTVDGVNPLVVDDRGYTMLSSIYGCFHKSE